MKIFEDETHSKYELSSTSVCAKQYRNDSPRTQKFPPQKISDNASPVGEVV